MILIFLNYTTFRCDSLQLESEGPGSNPGLVRMTLISKLPIYTFLIPKPFTNDEGIIWMWEEVVKPLMAV